MEDAFGFAILRVVTNMGGCTRKSKNPLSNPVELVRKPQPNNARTRRIAAADQATSTPDVGDAESEHGTQDGELESVAASGSAVLPSIVWLAVETTSRRNRHAALGVCGFEAVGGASASHEERQCW